MTARGALYSVPDLRERGWTATAIRRFLPLEPDDTRDNPMFSRKGAPMKFWLRERVERVEKAPEFEAWKRAAAPRKRAAAKAVATRENKMVERMRAATITIVRGRTHDQIYDLASRTHGGNYHGDPGPFRWSDRVARSCIRHNLTNYEALWAICNRGETGRAAYEVLRQRVDALIDEAYPEYAGWVLADREEAAS